MATFFTGGSPSRCSAMREIESAWPPKLAMATEPPLSCAAVLISGRLISQYSETTLPPAIITASAPLQAGTHDRLASPLTYRRLPRNQCHGRYGSSSEINNLHVKTIF